MKQTEPGVGRLSRPHPVNSRSEKRDISAVMSEDNKSHTLEFASAELTKFFDDLIAAGNAQPVENNGQRKVKVFHIGSSLFKEVPKDQLVDVYEALMAHLPAYYELRPEHREWKINEHDAKQFMTQCFLDFLNSAWGSPIARQMQRDSHSQEQNENESEEEIAKRKSQDAIRLDQVRRILDIIVPMDFSSQEKYWRHAFVMLRLKSYEEEFVNFVASKASKGEASCAVLHFCIRNEYLSKYIRGLKLIMQACLIGAVSGSVLEAYFASLPKDERRKARALVDYLKTLRENPKEYFEALRHYLGNPEAAATFPNVAQEFQEQFDKFKVTMNEIMRALSCQPPLNNKIDPIWAKKCVKEHIRKFCSGITSAEQMHDLLHNVIYQRRGLRAMAVSLLRKENLDEEANYYEQLEFARNYTPQIPIRGPQKIESIYETFGDAELLSLPPRVEVIVVDRNARGSLVKAFRSFEEAALSDFPFAGVDAEWTAYLPDARASVLQVALADVIYIFDLDSLSRDQNERLFKALFGNEKLIKVGFQFNEDLLKLRKVSPKVEFLYAPRSLICISLLIATVATLAGERNEAIINVPRNEKKDREQVAICTIAAKLKGLGLSKLLKEFTGLGLDKSEQCSVWTRRPLRHAQIRYGALDVYSLVIMVEKCLNLCSRWEENLISLVAHDYVTPVSMPLLFSVDCDPNLYPRIDILTMLAEMKTQ
ncbi:hypothetical protein QR680_001403 [Steinernema hermaphroditum]|uniref:3'-5' exonuclease domain-containing protein n=1 Tax=Steinernema hermaphroditum TaxID=289476 RepID=A0AA39LFE5_9BILA|nr:hypothetical protein QR680_001403 [Steinernema hermaphroditum]